MTKMWKYVYYYTAPKKQKVATCDRLNTLAVTCKVSRTPSALFTCDI